MAHRNENHHSYSDIVNQTSKHCVVQKQYNELLVGAHMGMPWMFSYENAVDS